MTNDDNTDPRDDADATTPADEADNAADEGTSPAEEASAKTDSLKPVARRSTSSKPRGKDKEAAVTARTPGKVQGAAAHRGRGLLVTSLLGLVALAAIVALAVVTWLYVDTKSDRDEDAAIVAVSRNFIVAVSNIDAENADSVVKRAAPYITDPVLTNLTKGGDQIINSAKQDNSSMVVSIDDVGTLWHGGDEARSFVMTTMNTQSTGTASQKAKFWAILKLKKVDGHWKVSDFGDTGLNADTDGTTTDPGQTTPTPGASTPAPSTPAPTTAAPSTPAPPAAPATP